MKKYLHGVQVKIQSIKLVIKLCYKKKKTCYKAIKFGNDNNYAILSETSLVLYTSMYR